jgi:hypothetical protein
LKYNKFIEQVCVFLKQTSLGKKVRKDGERGAYSRQKNRAFLAAQFSDLATNFAESHLQKSPHWDIILSEYRYVFRPRVEDAAAVNRAWLF